MAVFFAALFSELKEFYHTDEKNFILLKRKKKETLFRYKQNHYFYITGVGPLQKLHLLDIIPEVQWNFPVINVGWAGSSTRKFAIGEIVIPEKISSYKNPDQGVNILSLSLPWTKVEHLITFDSIMKQNQPMGFEYIVDMEAFDLYRILQKKIQAFVVAKVISDYLDDSSIDDIFLRNKHLLQKKISEVLQFFLYSF